MFVCLFECLRKSGKMAKDRSSLVRLRKREGLVNMRPRWFLIDHVSSWSRSPLTSADCYRCPSLYCLARVFQNLPAPHKHYGVFDVFADFQSFFQPENLGFALSTWIPHQNLAKYRKSWRCQYYKSSFQIEIILLCHCFQIKVHWCQAYNKHKIIALV